MRLIRKSELKGIFALLGVAAIVFGVLLALNGTLTDLYGIRFSSKPPLTDKIIFVSDRSGHRNIWTMNPDGSGQKPLTNDSHADLDPVVAPNGYMVAFISQRENSSNQIFAMDPDGTHQHRLSNVTGPKSSPEFSPDSREIVFQCSGQIWRIGWRGDKVERILPTERQTAMERLAEERSSYAWAARSFDGKLLAGVRSTREKQAIEWMKLTDEIPTPIVDQREGNTIPLDGETVFAEWSPDQEKLAVAMNTPKQVGALVVVDIENDSIDAIMPPAPSMGNPRWSPDGSKIVVEMLERLGPRDFRSVGLLLADPYGGDAKTLINGEATDARWSPDGTKIVFVRGNDICTVDVESRKVTNLTKGKGKNTSPSWAPEAKSK